MIVFDLLCSQGHGFEAWFRDSDSYERLSAAGNVQCAVCGDTKVKKALMAPAVRTAKAMPPPPAPKAESTSTGQDDKAAKEKVGAGSSPAPQQSVATQEVMPPSDSSFPEQVVEAMQMIRRVQSHIEKNFDHVGKGFAEEARKIHYGETEKRGIYGQATKEEAETLADEGIEVGQIPWLPSHDS